MYRFINPDADLPYVDDVLCNASQSWRLFVTAILGASYMELSFSSLSGFYWSTTSTRISKVVTTEVATASYTITP